MTPFDNKTYQREWYRKNAKRLRPILNARRQARAKEASAYHRAWRKKNKDRVLANESGYREANRPNINLNAARYRKNNRKKTNLAVYKSRAKRFRNDPKYRAIVLLKTYILMSIKRGGGCKSSKTVELLGCSIAEFRKHIESLWLPGMSWENHSVTGWHIDHIRPIASFDLSDPEHQKACFHWSNQQPLWAKDNIKKSDRWDAA